MTVAEAQPNILEFKGRMLMVTVLKLKSLDPGKLHQQVSQRLDEASQWLRDAPVVVDIYQPETVDHVDLIAAVDTLRGLGVNLVALARNDVMDSDTAAMLGLGSLSLSAGREVKQQEDSKPAPESSERGSLGAETLVISQPVRSGQQIYSRGDLIVLSSVSTGAELMAEGHIHVYNTLRGRALAGVRGDTQARIFCQKLNAELISIAGHYQVAEDIPDPHRNQAMQISLHDDALHFTSIS